jgi:hypothetical protein
MASKLQQDRGAMSGGASPSSPISKPLDFHPIESSDHDREHSIQASLGKKVSFSEHIAQGSGTMMARDGVLRHRTTDSAESSADEFTGILGAERGGVRDYATSAKPASAEATGTQSLGDPTGSIRNRRRTPNRPEEEPEKEDSWWKRTLDKYGSVELENKGSVARDHLALGTFNLTALFYLFVHVHASIIIYTDLCSPDRAHLPRMATNLSLIRKHRHSYNTALPPEHLHHWWQQPYTAKPAFTSCWKTSWLNFHCY